MYDKNLYNDLLKKHAPLDAFARSLFPWAAADLILDAISIGGGLDDFRKRLVLAHGEYV